MARQGDIEFVFFGTDGQDLRLGAPNEHLLSLAAANAHWRKTGVGVAPKNR